MRRALMWLNLYGCQAVLHKLKSSLKIRSAADMPQFTEQNFSITKNLQKDDNKWAPIFWHPQWIVAATVKY